MKKGKKTEALNENIEAIAVMKQTGVATRLQLHIDNIVGMFNSAAERLIEVGSELKAIRDECEGDYAGTFEGLVKEVFGKTRGWAYQYIDAYEARLSLPESVQHEIQNPRQALALVSIPAAKREKVIQGVVNSGDKVTSTAIKAEAARQDKAEKAVEVEHFELDELGNKIPHEILPEWNRAKEEVEEARSCLSAVSIWFRDGLGDGKNKKRDPIFRAVTLSNKKLFDDIKRQIAMVEPYVVCPTCVGTTHVKSKPCPHCKGTGFISKFEYEHVDSNAKSKKKDEEKPAKITQRFATFIEHAHNGSAISIHWDVDKGRGEVELKDGTNLAFEEKDGEFKLIPEEEIF